MSVAQPIVASGRRTRSLTAAAASVGKRALILATTLGALLVPVSAASSDAVKTAPVRCTPTSVARLILHSSAPRYMRDEIRESLAPKRPGEYGGPIGVSKVYCGDYTRDGRTDLVATVDDGGTIGVTAWVVLEGTVSGWRFAFVSYGRASPQPAHLWVEPTNGGDLLETQPIYLPGDPNCCATGGIRNTQWRWNGHTFKTVKTWTTIAPMSGTSNSYHFQSPSENIGCYLGPAGVDCQVAKYSWPKVPTKPESCQWDFLPTEITLVGTTVTVGHCRGDIGPLCYSDSRCEVLVYGASVVAGRIRCTSATNGITCRRLDGRRVGFRIAREGYRLFP